MVIKKGEKKMKRILPTVITFLLIVSVFAILTSDVKAASVEFQMQPLVEGPAHDVGPSILQDSNGKIWVFFQSYDRIDAGHYHVFYVASVDGGSTWTDPAVFLPAFVPGLSVVAEPAVLRDSTGKLWVAWQYAYEIWFTTSSDGINWADAKLFCSGDNKIGSFIETGGKIWFFFSSSLPNWMRISYKTTIDGGNSWSDLVSITGSGYFYPHAIVLDNGTILVAYQHYPYSMHYCTSSDSGSTWSEATFDNPDSDRDPYCIEYGGKIYVFFNRLYNDPFSHPHTTSDIWFRVSDETGWEPPQPLTNEPQNFDNCATPARIRNQLWVVWGKAIGDSYTPQDIWLARMYLKLEDFYLHGGASLNNNSPTATTAKYEDSPSIKFSGGNPWKEIGTWTASASLTDGRLTALGDLGVWLGLKNSDDQGTNFDLRAEVYKNGVLVASGETYLIKGVTRNPDKASKVTVSFASFSPVDFDGTNDTLSLRILTRIGTDGHGNFGGGHSSAVGLRLYFDAVSRPAMLAVSIA
jgi:hypothetical protein